MYFKFLVFILVSFMFFSCDSNKTVRVSLSDSSNDVTDQDTTDDTSNDSDQGDTGDTGDTSDTGDTADTGNTGDSSDTGNTADTGNTGDTADTGNTADTGDTGDTGDTADTGNTGDTADTGNTGDTADTGNTGDTGDTADTGDTGTECSGDETRTIPCGSMGQGTQDQICMGGFWGDVGGCVLPQGAWDCVGNVCTPVFNAGSCGNGTCEPRSGESRKSCPKDCDFSAIDGEGKGCKDAFDCIFYKWTLSSKGYWDCEGYGDNKKCSAAGSNLYCGTQGYNYCYIATNTIESDLSCPEDCANKTLGQYSGGTSCNAKSDCVFVDWPQ